MDITATTEAKYQRLQSILHEMGSVLVAYSGGVDSAFLLKVASETLGDRALGVIAVSPSIAAGEVAEALALAEAMGARVETVESHEMDREGYVQNGPERCYHCKTELFSVLLPIARERGFAYVADGFNLDDLGDYRPGLRAERELGARAPLREAELTKAEIRQLSLRLGLPMWNKPSMACLASRIPYGTAIDPAQLAQVYRAEMAIRKRGFHSVRVRHHGEVARIEVDPQDFARLVSPDMAAQIVAELKTIGFQYVTMDLGGYRTGSLNELIGVKPVAGSW